MSIRMAIILFLLMLDLSVVAANASNESEAILPNDFSRPMNYSYEEIDRHALNAPSSAESTIGSLAAYLIEPAKNDREKARAIFRWIAENIDYNVDVFFGGSSGSIRSEDVLKSRRSICYGYSDLFLSLAGEAGLEAVRITGYGKGYGYVPGRAFSGLSNHAWNAVRINGSWYLIDCSWGAGYVTSEGKYVRKFDDHYFMTPPSQFIFSHFPEDARWQLLDLPLTKEEYENLVYLDADFFNLGLMLGARNGTINVADQVNISILAPQDVLMMANIERVNPGSSGDALDRYAFCQRDKDRYDIYARFPEASSYILKAYGKRRDNPGEYDSVLEYGVNASSGGGVDFPVAYEAFNNNGAHLFGPMEGRLKAGSSYLFRIRVPGAKSVSVVSGKEWTSLASRGDIFEGNATIGKGDLLIFGKFRDENWDGLLRYASY
jgi:hypothetical protein